MYSGICSEVCFYLYLGSEVFEKECLTTHHLSKFYSGYWNLPEEIRRLGLTGFGLTIFLFICLPSMARLLRKNSQRGPANQRQSPSCGHRVPHSSVSAESLQTLLGLQWKCDSDRQSGGPTPSQLRAVYLHAGWDKTALGLAEQQHWETDLGF